MISRKIVLQLIFFVAFFSLTFAQDKHFTLPAHTIESDYLPKTIIFNVKPQYREACNENTISIEKLNNAFDAIGATAIGKKFPRKKAPAEKFNRYGEKMEDLSLIYELKYTSDISIEKAINILLESNTLEYAEPHYIYHLFTAYNPNDLYADTTSSQFAQWHLEKIKAYEAWGIQRGDTNIVIGITDTGTDTLHPDLAVNLKINYADLPNGIDDDNDGYIDNYHGWNLGENNNSPQWHKIAHGVHVTGLSSAVANNKIGCAGTSFNCKYLPVKIDDENGVITMGYEGIVYAADHGCCIINCSWGGYGGAGNFGQSIINYATNNMNALVVAAAGNSNNSYPIYPASYNNVLSVAATDVNDRRWYDAVDGTGSNWGITVGLAAPGDSLLSTVKNESYGWGTGTSMASSVVSGAAAIVKAAYPGYAAAQIAARLQAYTDNIDTIPFNVQYAGMLGTGRLNMYKALTGSGPWIVMIKDSINDGNDQLFVVGDTLRISGLFKNLLDPSYSGLKVTVSCQSPYVSIIDSVSLLGTITTLGTKNNYSNPFKVKLSLSMPLSEEIIFKLKFEDIASNYSSAQYFSIIVNLDYMNINVNKIATTLTSKGQLGYNQFASLTQGIGFTYNGSRSYLSCGGFMVGNSTSQVADNIYGPTVNSFDNRFKTSKAIYKKMPSVVSDFDAESIFNDSLAGVSQMNLTITNNTYSWKNFPRDKFIITEYTIKNNGTSALSSLYAGLFMDFNISASDTADRIAFDATNRMSYTYCSTGGNYAAIQLLSAGNLHHYAIDKNGAFSSIDNTTSINIDDGFTNWEKYSALTTNGRNYAGTAPTGNDVADLMSSGPFSLNPGDSVVVTFALIGGDNLADIQASAVAANQIYNHSAIKENVLSNELQLSDIFPNPANDNFSFNLFMPASVAVNLCLIDQTGKTVKAIKDGTLSQGTHQFTVQTKTLQAGLYHLQLLLEGRSILRDVSIIH